MTKKLKFFITLGLALSIISLFCWTPIVQAEGVKGSIKIVPSSAELIGLVYAVNPGGEKMMINYQIPPLDPENPTFWVPFAISIQRPTSGQGKARINLDTRFCLTNTSEQDISLKAILYTAQGKEILEIDYTLGSHQTLCDSVLRIVRKKTGYESDFSEDFDQEFFD
jgi:hypothetical protein